jgi:ligand-binding SRPBCC domain-containing protein
VLDASSILVTEPEDVPEHPYLAERPPSWELRSALDVAAPVETVFAWFCRPENLPLVTPPANALALETPTPIEMREGTEIDYQLPIAGLRAAWRTHVLTWDPPRSFVDVATKGPFRCWWHEHRFEPTATGAHIRDRVLFSAPLGPIGRAAEATWVRPMLQRLFLYRRNAIRQRFAG